MRKNMARAKKQSLSPIELEALRYVVANPVPLDELDKFFPKTVVDSLLEKGLIEIRDNVGIHRLQGKEIVSIIQAETFEDLDKVIANMGRLADESGMEPPKVLERGVDPDGGKRAVVTAHNVNGGYAGGIAYGQAFAAATAAGANVAQAATAGQGAMIDGGTPSGTPSLIKSGIEAVQPAALIKEGIEAVQPAAPTRGDTGEGSGIPSDIAPLVKGGLEGGLPTKDTGETPAALVVATPYGIFEKGTGKKVAPADVGYKETEGWKGVPRLIGAGKAGETTPSPLEAPEIKGGPPVFLTYADAQARFGELAPTDDKYAQEHPEQVVQVGNDFFRVVAQAGAEGYKQILELGHQPNLAAQLACIEKNPDMRVPDAIRQNIERQFAIYTKLTGEEQFNKAVELGFLPQGSVFAELPKEVQRIAEDEGLGAAFAKWNENFASLPTTEVGGVAPGWSVATPKGLEIFMAGLAEGKPIPEIMAEVKSEIGPVTVYDMEKIVGNPEHERIFTENVPQGADWIAAWKGDASAYQILTGQTVPANPQAVVVTTMAGNEITMPKDQWDNMPSIEQFKIYLGRNPTLSEWIGYKLNEQVEAGNIPSWEVMFSKGFGRIGTAMMSAFPHREEQPSAKIYPTIEKATLEWQNKYATTVSNQAKASAITALEEFGFAGAKALYPQIEIKDITPEEWIQTSVATLATIAFPLSFGGGTAASVALYGMFPVAGIGASYLTIKHAGEMSPADLAISGAMDLLYFLPVGLKGFSKVGFAKVEAPLKPVAEGGVARATVVEVGAAVEAPKIMPELQAVIDSQIERLGTVNRFARVVADVKGTAETAIATAKDVPALTRDALRVALNDLDYAYARVGEAIKSAPSVASQAVRVAIDNLQIVASRVLEIIKSIPSAAAEEITKAVDNAKALAGEARLFASEGTRIVANDISYALDRLAEAIKASPDLMSKMVQDAIANVQVAVSKARGVIEDMPGVMGRELRDTLVRLQVTASDIKLLTDMSVRAVLNDVNYAVSQLVDAIKVSGDWASNAVQSALANVGTATSRAVGVAKGIPGVASEALVNTLNRLSEITGEAKQFVGESVRIALNDVNYVVGQMVEMTRASPGIAREAIQSAVTKARASVDSAMAQAKLFASEGVRIAVNDISYALDRLVEAVKASPNLMSKAVQDAIVKVQMATSKAVVAIGEAKQFVGESVRIALNDVNYALERLGMAIKASPDLASKAVQNALAEVRIATNKAIGMVKGIPGVASERLASTLDTLGRLSSEVRQFTDEAVRMAMNDVAYSMAQMVEAIKASPDLASKTVGSAIDSLQVVTDRAIVVAKNLPDAVGGQLRSGLNGIIDATNRLKSAIKSGTAISSDAVKVAVNDISHALDQMAEAIKKSPSAAREVAEEALLTAKVRIKQLPDQIEMSARDYLDNLRSQIYMAEQTKPMYEGLSEIQGKVNALAKLLQRVDADPVAISRALADIQSSMDRVLSQPSGVFVDRNAIALAFDRLNTSLGRLSAGIPTEVVGGVAWPEGVLAKPGSPVVWRGIKLGDRPLVGISRGKLTVGEKGITFPPLKAWELPLTTKEGAPFEPRTRIETKVFINRDALIKAGMTEESATTFVDRMKGALGEHITKWYGKKSPYMFEELFKEPIDTIDQAGVKALLEYIVETKDKVVSIGMFDRLFGSGTMPTQLSPKALAEWKNVFGRLSGDFDIQLKNVNAEGAAAWTRGAVEAINRASEHKVWVDPQRDTLVGGESLIKNPGMKRHALDIHYEGEPPIEGMSSPEHAEMVYGLKKVSPAVTVDVQGIGKFDIARLSETGVGKAEQVLGWRMNPETGEVELAIEPHRFPKDIIDLYEINKTYLGEAKADALLDLLGYDKAELIRISRGIREATANAEVALSDASQGIRDIRDMVESGIGIRDPKVQQGLADIRNNLARASEGVKDMPQTEAKIYYTKAADVVRELDDLANKLKSPKVEGIKAQATQVMLNKENMDISVVLDRNPATKYHKLSGADTHITLFKEKSPALMKALERNIKDIPDVVFEDRLYNLRGREIQILKLENQEVWNNWVNKIRGEAGLEETKRLFHTTISSNEPSIRLRSGAVDLSGATIEELPSRVEAGITSADVGQQLSAINQNIEAPVGRELYRFSPSADASVSNIGKHTPLYEIASPALLSAATSYAVGMTSEGNIVTIPSKSLPKSPSEYLDIPSGIKASISQAVSSSLDLPPSEIESLMASSQVSKAVSAMESKGVSPSTVSSLSRAISSSLSLSPSQSRSLSASLSSSLSPSPYPYPYPSEGTGGRIKLPSLTGEAKREAFRGSLGWAQGFGFWAIKEPYMSKEDTAFFYKEPPPGFRIVEGGPKEAFRSIQQIVGAAPEELAVRMGFMKVKIKQPKATPGASGAIEFVREVKEKTPVDIVLGKEEETMGKQTLKAFEAPARLPGAKGGGAEEAPPEPLGNRGGNGKARGRIKGENEESLTKIPVHSTLEQLVTVASEGGPRGEWAETQGITRKLSELTPEEVAEEMRRMGLDTATIDNLSASEGEGENLMMAGESLGGEGTGRNPAEDKLSMRDMILSHLPNGERKQVEFYLDSPPEFAPTRGYPKAKMPPTKLRRRRNPEAQLSGISL